MLERYLESAKGKLKSYWRYFMIFVVFLALLSLIRNVLKVSRANKQIHDAQVKVEDLRLENENFKAEVEHLESEEFVEKQIRDKLGLAKEGEIIVVLPEDEILRKLAPRRIEEEQILPDPNWKKWIQLFGY